MVPPQGESTSSAARPPVVTELLAALPPAAEAALDALRLDRGRTRAGVLCVAAGMAVIVSLVSIVAGGRRELLRAVEAAGPANVFLRTAAVGAPGAPGPATLTTSEIVSARARFPGLPGAAAVRSGTVELRTGGFRERVPFYAASESIGSVFPLRAERGRFLGEMDFRSRAPVALLGADLARRLGALGDPVGRTLELAAAMVRPDGPRDGASGAGGGSPITVQVVGTLPSLATDAGSGADLSGLDWNRGLLLPLGSEPLAAAAPEDDYPADVAVLRFRSPSDAQAAARVLAGLLLESGREGVLVTTPAQALAQYRAARRSFDRVALLVSVLTTLSAAFGITNLLRASVRARSSEIGLRRSVGARQTDIRGQFLLEGLFIGVLGGAVGILAGAVLSWTLLSRAGWKPSFDLPVLVALVLGSAVFGILAGLSPAAEAARLDPGVALRVE